ncbi:Guanine nucleotide-binding protein subunit alpha-14 [Podochytrium sp. JEL0797]|nr:Guanine nucleotide-binding protein subunit alpha-14 [Podochytrium sp. JEL0797]
MGGCTSQPTTTASKVEPVDPAIQAAAVLKTKDIDRQLLDESKSARKEVKILLLGTAETGKSTVLKQLRIIHGGGFTDADLKTFRGVARRNIYDTVKILTDAMEKLKIPYGFDSTSPEMKKLGEVKPGCGGSMNLREDPVAIEAARLFSIDTVVGVNRGKILEAVSVIRADTPDFNNVMGVRLVDAIRLVWGDSGIKYCFSRANEFQIVDLS